MEIRIDTNFDLNKLDIGLVNQLGLTESAQEIKGMASDNAPYQTGKLSQSITTEPGYIGKNTTQVRVGPRKLVYAVVREFINKKNPSKKFYMKRAYENSTDIITRAFKKAIEIAIKKM